MPTPVSAVSLSDSDQQQLQEWVSAHGTPQQVALRCRIVLAAAAGQSDNSVAEECQINRKTVMLWRTRFAQQGLRSLWEIAPGRGRKPTYGSEKIQSIIDTTLQSKPKGRTQWSCRSLAQRLGVSKSTVNNIWRSHNLKPHRVKTFKLSRDPHFLEKLTDVVGLYLNPPEKAIVLCVDEKSQIQALDRTQPGLPMKKGRCGTMTHDYKRNGTTTLFAALELAQGKVVGECYQRHRHQEFLKFLRRRRGISRTGSPAPGHGQLRHPQEARGPRVAGEASPFPASFCADQFQLAELGGALVRRVVEPVYSPGCLRQRRGPERSHHGVSGRLE
jgi:transposase